MGYNVWQYLTYNRGWDGVLSGSASALNSELTD